jgi:hypothetical protein
MSKVVRQGDPLEPTLTEKVGGVEKYREVSREEMNKADEAMIHVGIRYPVPTAWPSIIGWRHNGFAFYNGTAAGYLREAQIPPDADTSFKKIRMT